MTLIADDRNSTANDLHVFLRLHRNPTIPILRSRSCFSPAHRQANGLDIRGSRVRGYGVRDIVLAFLTVTLADSRKKCTDHISRHQSCPRPSTLIYTTTSSSSHSFNRLSTDAWPLTRSSRFVLTPRSISISTWNADPNRVASALSRTSLRGWKLLS